MEIQLIALDIGNRSQQMKANLLRNPGVYRTLHTKKSNRKRYSWKKQIGHKSLGRAQSGWGYMEPMKPWRCQENPEVK